MSTRREEGQTMTEYAVILAVITPAIVLAYTVSIYWIFRGKVKLDRMSY